MRLPIALVSLALAAFAAHCVPAPKKAYTPDEIPQINEIDEIMHVQAHVADPVFGKRDQEAFSDDEFAEMVRVGKLLQATGATLADKFAKDHGGESFASFANGLKAQAAKLEAAGTAKNAEDTRGALTAIKTQCAACHSKHR